jgi:hypothetical protein
MTFSGGDGHLPGGRMAAIAGELLTYSGTSAMSSPPFRLPLGYSFLFLRVLITTLRLHGTEG